MHPFALLAPHDYAGITEDFHMMRQCGLRYGYFLKQLACAFFASDKKLQDPDPVFVAERLENRRNSPFVKLQAIHLTSTFIYIIGAVPGNVNGF